MKVVIADTSPLNYLVLIDLVDILPRLYATVLVPPEVVAELVDPGTPALVAQWIQNRPEWLLVTAASPTEDASLSQLDPGERAAILLAQEQGNDDGAGRMAAHARAFLPSERSVFCVQQP